MEFEIDFPMVRGITSQEYRQAHVEIAELGALPSYRRSCERHDARLAAAPDASTLACKAGCSWCCYFSVDVRAVEVFDILEFVAREFTAEQRTCLRREIDTNSALLKQLSDLERVQRNIKCPFLAAGRCTIYTARPQTCRNYHATDATGCRKSFEEPGNLDIDPDFAPLTYQTGGAHVDAFCKAMRDAGYDTAAYELNTALAVAMADPVAARRQFELKSRPFAELQGADVPLEFLDADTSI